MTPAFFAARPPPKRRTGGEDGVEGGARGFTANNLLHYKTRMLSKAPKILLIDLITIDWMEPYIILR